MYIKNADQLFKLDSSMIFGIKPVYHELIADLGNFDIQKRMDALIILRHLIDTGEIASPKRTDAAITQVHTWYSFSPYTPAMAVWMAYMSGLCCVGIADSDSVGGAREFIRSGEIMRIRSTVGAMLRVNFGETKAASRYFNNPFEPSVAKIAAMGIPQSQIEKLDEILLADIRHSRNVRTAIETWNVRSILPDRELRPDFWNEIIDYSLYCFGNGEITKNRNYMSGSVNECHILFGVARRLLNKYGHGERLIQAIEESLKIPLSQKSKELLGNTDSQVEFELIDILRKDFIPKIYHPSFGDAETPSDALPVQNVVQKIRSIGGIPCYYFSGYRRDEKSSDSINFEDEFLDELFPMLKDLGFEAVSYSPISGTREQLERIISLCDRFEFMQICGQEINYPAQKFVCDVLSEPMFAHLSDSVWALIGHEEAADRDIEDGIFSEKTKNTYPDLKTRIAHFKDIGLKFKR